MTGIVDQHGKELACRGNCLALVDSGFLFAFFVLIHNKINRNHFHWRSNKGDGSDQQLHRCKTHWKQYGHGQFNFSPKNQKTLNVLNNKIMDDKLQLF